MHNKSKFGVHGVTLECTSNAYAESDGKWERTEKECYVWDMGLFRVKPRSVKNDPSCAIRQPNKMKRIVDDEAKKVEYKVERKCMRGKKIETEDAKKR